jgi:hypothetical protein
MARPDDVADEVTGRLRAGTARGGEGFFRVAQTEGGKWWLLDPDGRAFFLCGVQEVRAAGGQGDGALPLDAAARLRKWEFNT